MRWIGMLRERRRKRATRRAYVAAAFYGKLDATLKAISGASKVVERFIVSAEPEPCGSVARACGGFKVAESGAEILAKQVWKGAACSKGGAEINGLCDVRRAGLLLVLDSRGHVEDDRDRNKRKAEQLRVRDGHRAGMRIGGRVLLGPVDKEEDVAGPRDLGDRVVVWLLDRLGGCLERGDGRDGCRERVVDRGWGRLAGRRTVCAYDGRTMVVHRRGGGAEGQGGHLVHGSPRHARLEGLRRSAQIGRNRGDRRWQRGLARVWYRSVGRAGRDWRRACVRLRSGHVTSQSRTRLWRNTTTTTVESSQPISSSLSSPSCLSPPPSLPSFRPEMPLPPRAAAPPAQPSALPKLVSPGASGSQKGALIPKFRVNLLLTTP